VENRKIIGRGERIRHSIERKELKEVRKVSDFLPCTWKEPYYKEKYRGRKVRWSMEKKSKRSKG